MHEGELLIISKASVAGNGSGNANGNGNGNVLKAYQIMNTIGIWWAV